MTDDELRALIAEATPGPWNAATWQGQEWPDYRWSVSSSRIGGTASAVCICPRYANPEDLSDARLIAAAPDLAAEVLRLREISLKIAGALNAAISLLEKGGREAAPSDKMFNQMIEDYRGHLERYRAALRDT